MAKGWDLGLGFGGLGCRVYVLKFLAGLGFRGQGYYLSGE